jgi:predicted transposase YdaD
LRKKWRKKGEKNGSYNKAIAIAKQLLNFNLSLEEISKITDVPIHELERINKEK